MAVGWFKSGPPAIGRLTFSVSLLCSFLVVFSFSVSLFCSCSMVTPEVTPVLTYHSVGPKRFRGLVVATGARPARCREEAPGRRAQRNRRMFQMAQWISKRFIRCYNSEHLQIKEPHCTAQIKINGSAGLPAKLLKISRETCLICRLGHHHRPFRARPFRPRSRRGARTRR